MNTPQDQPPDQLYVWEIVKLVPHQIDANHHIRCTALVAAKTINDVWDSLAADRIDERIEIETINRVGPLAGIIRPFGPAMEIVPQQP